MELTKMKDKRLTWNIKQSEIVVCQIEEKSLTENTDIEIPSKGNGDKKKKKKERKYPTK